MKVFNKSFVVRISKEFREILDHFDNLDDLINSYIGTYDFPHDDYRTCTFILFDLKEIRSLFEDFAKSNNFEL